MSNCELSLYSNNYIDTTKEPLFFGCARNTQRYDKNRYEKLSKLAMDMQRLFWIPEEIKLLGDKAEFENLATISEKHILTTQLQKLVMLDSLQGRTPLLIFGQLTTNPEFEACLLEQEYFEARIHSRSYSYIVEEMYANPSEIFDDTWNNKELRKEINTITREYNILYYMVTDYLYFKKNNIEISEEFMHELKKYILLSLVSMNILEGIRFYMGFSAIWAINEFSQKFIGVGRILQLIARDENKHLEFTQSLIKILKRDPNFKDIWTEITGKIYDMYWEASEEEIKWSKVLFEKGNILGFNEEIGSLFIKYLTNWRLKSIGLKLIYPEVNKNPLKWLGRYVNLHNTDKALQESEETDYIANPVKDEKVNYEELFEEL